LRSVIRGGGELCDLSGVQLLQSWLAAADRRTDGRTDLGTQPGHYTATTTTKTGRVAWWIDLCRTVRSILVLYRHCRPTTTQSFCSRNATRISLFHYTDSYLRQLKNVPTSTEKNRFSRRRRAWRRLAVCSLASYISRKSCNTGNQTKQTSTDRLKTANVVRPCLHKRATNKEVSMAAIFYLRESAC